MVTIEGANIVQSEVFVYNLGTMFYIDKVLFANKLPDIDFAPTTDRTEWSDDTGPTHPDVLLQDSTTTEEQIASTTLPWTMNNGPVELY